MEFARTIHGAGTDLLNLITDILDLSKIESGTVTVDAEEASFSSLVDIVNRTFNHEAERKGLSFDVHVDTAARVAASSRIPSACSRCSKTCLSNAFKFTSQGGVRFNVSSAAGGWTPDHPVLSQAGTVVSFEVSDTRHRYSD